MTTVDALNRPRSLMWGILSVGSRLAGIIIVVASVVTLWAWSGNWLWTRYISPTVETLGVNAIQFAGKDIVAEPVQIAAINPATDNNNTRLRNLDVELDQAVRGRK